MNISQIKRGLKKCCNNPWRIFMYIDELGLLKWMGDERNLRLIFRARLGRKLNLNNPQTYNEKLQWLKLYNRKPEYTRMVDKYEAKQYIAERIGEGYTIPTLGVWDRFEDIDFNTLPDQFVLKCTHDSGGLVICRNKSELDLKIVKRRIEKSLKTNYYLHGREWPYKDVTPRIIAEEYMEETNSDGGTGQKNCLTDYKVFCFNGQPKIIYVSKDKADDPRTDFFDMDFNHLPIRMRDPQSDVPPPKPVLFEEMKRISTILSQGHPHLRVDFYQINGRLYVGELTFFHCSGTVAVNPEEWNLKMGSWIDLPEKTTYKP